MIKVYFTLAIGFCLLVGCKTGTDGDSNISQVPDTTISAPIPVEPNDGIGDSGMPIPKELLEPQTKIVFDMPDISLKQSYRDTFEVSTPAELYAAMGSDRVIMIKDGIYKLEKGLPITYQHIKLEGKGKPTIQFIDPKLTSIIIHTSSSVWLSNLVLDIGFPASEVCRMDGCMTNMIDIRKSDNVILEYITMANTPISSFHTDEANNVLIYEMHVENSYGFGVFLYNSDNIIIQSSTFKDLKTGDTAFSAYAPKLTSYNVYFDHVEIDNVTAESGDESGPVLFSSKVLLYKCKISNAPGLSLGVNEEYVLDSEINL